MTDEPKKDRWTGIAFRIPAQERLRLEAVQRRAAGEFGLPSLAQVARACMLRGLEALEREQHEVDLPGAGAS